MKTLPIPWSRDMPDDPMAVTPAKVVMGQLTRLNFGYRGLGSVVPAPGTVEVFITVGTPAGDLIYHSPGNTTNTVQIGADNNFYLDLTATELSLPPDLVYCVEARDTTPGSETVLARRRFEVEASAAFSPLLPPPILIVGLNLGGTNANLAGAPDGVVFKAGAGMVVHALDPATLAVVGGVLTAIGGGGGGSAVPTTRVITINGTALDLSADRTFTITDANLSISDITTNNVSTAKHGFAPKAPNDATKFLDGTGAYSTPAGGMSIGGSVTGGTAGLIPYIAAGPVLAQSANLSFNGTNFGVGTSAPLDRFDVHVSSTKVFLVRLIGGTVQLLACDDPLTTYKEMYCDANPLRINTLSAGVVDFGSGKVGLNIASPAAQLHVVAGSASTVGQIVGISSSATADAFQVRTTDNGYVLASLGLAGSSPINTIFALRGSTGGSASGSFYFDGPDSSNAAYAAFGITTTGSYFGVTGYTVFASSKNGTGTQLPMTFGGFSGSWTHWMTISTAGVVAVRLGTSTSFAKVGGAIFDHYTDGGSVGTAETTLATDTVAANTLATNGDKIEATYGITLVNSASTKQPKLYFAGSAIWAPGAITMSGGAGYVAIKVLIERVSATVVRFVMTATIWNGGVASLGINVDELTGLTLSGSNILKVTGTAAGGAAADNDLVCKLASVKWIPAA
jgi:hypothetical protein